MHSSYSWAASTQHGKVDCSLWASRMSSCTHYLVEGKSWKGPIPAEILLAICIQLCPHIIMRPVSSLGCDEQVQLLMVLLLGGSVERDFLLRLLLLG